MANEPMPHQLTVGQLRHILEDAQEQAVVTLRLPAGYHSHPKLIAFVNLEVEITGATVTFSPQLCPSGEELVS